jgi:shikimate dehydrogenase
MDYLDEISPEAKSIGAVNCIVQKNNKLIGYNTDYYGILDSFKKLNLTLKNKKVLILGTGGAARTVFKILKDLNANILVATRNITGADFFPRNLLITYSELELKTPSGYLIINCTPIGSKNFLNESPVSKKVVSNFKYVFDLIYNPPLTKFLSFCKIPTNSLNGLPMLITQAMKSQEIWNDKILITTIKESLCKK